MARSSQSRQPFSLHQARASSQAIVISATSVSTPWLSRKRAASQTSSTGCSALTTSQSPSHFLHSTARFSAITLGTFMLAFNVTSPAETLTVTGNVFVFVQSTDPQSRSTITPMKGPALGPFPGPVSKASSVALVWPSVLALAPLAHVVPLHTSPAVHTVSGLALARSYSSMPMRAIGPSSSQRTRLEEASRGIRVIRTSHGAVTFAFLADSPSSGLLS